MSLASKSLRPARSAAPGADEQRAIRENLLDRAHVALQGLAHDCSLALLSSANQTSKIYKVERATGAFAACIGTEAQIPRKASRYPFGLRPGHVLITASSEIPLVETLNLPLPNSSLALTAVSLGAHGELVIVLAKESALGPFSEQLIQGLRAIAEMTALAAGQPLETSQLVPHTETRRSTPAAVPSVGVLSEASSYYQHFAEVIRQCFWVLDLDTNQVVWISENCERVIGADRTALATRGLTGFMASVCPEDRDRVLSEFYTQLGTELEIEMRIVAPDGELHWIWVRGYPFEETTMDMAHSRKFVMIADDITDRKIEEERIRSREAELVSRSQSVAVVDLATGVAHEINNPLTIIVGRAAELKRFAEKLGPEAAEFLNATADKIQSTSIRISEIVKSLKSLARRDGAARLKPASFGKIANDIRDICSERFKAHDVGLQIEDPPSDLVAEINVTLISQLLLNLVNNAFDAIEKEKSRWVKVEFLQDEDSVYLSVTDSGPGIPIKIRGRIFDPFFTTKEPGKGTGLGLSLASSIAAHHGGSIRIDTLHSHTRFVVQLPKRAVAAK